MGFWYPSFWLVWDSGLCLVSDWYGILVGTMFLIGTGFWLVPGFCLVWVYVVGLYLVSGWSHWYTLYIEYNLCIVVCECMRTSITHHTSTSLCMCGCCLINCHRLFIILFSRNHNLTLCMYMRTLSLLIVLQHVYMYM